MKQIPLTQGKFAQVSDHRFEKANQFKWFAGCHDGIWYAERTDRVSAKQKTISLHRFLMDVTDPNILVDHKDGDGLNCQDSNLRVCTPAQNAQNQKIHKNNTSGYKGVSWIRRDKKWQVKIKTNYQELHIGYFDDPIEAAHAYDTKARELHGEFARTNF